LGLKLLYVFCHPDPNSYGAAVSAAARKALEDEGHEVKLIDLYAEGFNPILSLEEKTNYLPNPAHNIALLQPHVDALQWAEGLIVYFPTWYYGPPAMLKGWFERVWLPGVTFEPPKKKGDRVEGKLKNIRLFIGITTSGSPWWWLRLIGDPGRSIFMRGFRPLYAKRCKMQWLQLHNMNNTTQRDREKFLDKVQRNMQKIQ
jgi:NAD(P)H dehydrogenase (quinone)